MGCVSSSFLEDESGNHTPVFGHHIVSLTSTTYGLLSTLDTSTPQQTPPPPPPPPLPPPLSPLPSSISSLPRLRPEPEIINSWDLMAGLDPLTPFKPLTSTKPLDPRKENAHRSLHFSDSPKKTISPLRHSVESFEKRCAPGGEQAVVLYTTTLRAIRKTFEDCNAVRAAFEGLAVWVLERDVSMDLEFREELRWLMGGSVALPRVFVRGRYIGGADQVLQIHEKGLLGVLVEGLPKVRHIGACDGCGGGRFLPCFRCSGSRKLVVPVGHVGKGCGGEWRKKKTVRCPDCNENGLMFCPICS